MSRRKEPRRLSDAERALWQKVTETAVPLNRAKPDIAPETPPAPTAPRPKTSTAIPAFSIGARAPGKPTAQDPPGPRPAAPVAMDKRAFGRMKRGQLKPEGRIDLHGMTLAEAHPALIGFILQSASRGKRLVLVITGKGKRAADDGPIPVRRGVLRHQVPQWLSAPPLAPLVLQVAEAHASHGGGGAYYVYLRRARSDTR